MLPVLRPALTITEQMPGLVEIRALIVTNRRVGAGLVQFRLLPLARLVPGLSDEPVQVGDLAPAPFGDAELAAIGGALVGGQAIATARRRTSVSLPWLVTSSAKA